MPLLEAYGAVGAGAGGGESAGAGTARAMAILDWREVPTYNEFVFVGGLFFRARGLEARIVDPRGNRAARRVGSWRMGEAIDPDLQARPHQRARGNGAASNQPGDPRRPVRRGVYG